MPTRSVRVLRRSTSFRDSVRFVIARRICTLTIPGGGRNRGAAARSPRTEARGLRGPDKGAVKVHYCSYTVYTVCPETPPVKSEPLVDRSFELLAKIGIGTENEIASACHPERASSTSESKGPHKLSSALLYEVCALFPVGILRLRDPSGRSAQDDMFGSFARG